MPKRISLKHKILLITIIIFGGILFIAAGIILPSIKYIDGIKHEIEQTEAQLEEQYQKIRLLKKSINELAEVKQKTQKLKTITIAQGDELRVIQELEQLAPKHGVQQSLGVSYGDSAYTFSFQVSGDFYKLIKYVYDLETLPYYINISSMNWSGGGENASVKFTGKIHSS
ncbi:hypothetical protein C0581_04165 [Candidatus Parcubacteria bacterium]|nr:MAG: hypothetical protein C0581_04165 [Candidatus Parcubacteria bacterium]